MRYSVGLLAVGLLSGLLAGCGESGDLKEGMPENVDMSKTYTPAAGTPLITPDQAAKAKAAGAAGTAPPMPTAPR